MKKGTKKQEKNENAVTIKVTGVYLTNKPISSFPNQTTISMNNEDNSANRIFHTALEMASRRTSQPDARIK